MKIVDCNLEHAAVLRELLNPYITDSTAVFKDRPLDASTAEAWVRGKLDDRQPILGAVADDGRLMGFATYGPFRSQAGFRHTVEHSVWVSAAFQRRGIGRSLLEALIERARLQRHHVMIGAIDFANQPSLNLHEQLGFVRSARLRQVGFKFGQWRDLCLVQRVLDAPSS